MDSVTAVTLVLAITSEHTDVDILKQLMSYEKEGITANRLQSARNEWRVQFGQQSLVLKQLQECASLKAGSPETCIEYESLVSHSQLCPGFVPRPYCWSAKHSAMLVEDVGSIVTLSDEIIASRVDMTAIKKLGATLGLLHKQSHNASNSVVVRDLMKKFSSNSGVGQMVHEIFENTFDVERMNNEAVKAQLTKLSSDKNTMDMVSSLKNKVLHRKECLSHAFINTAAVIVNDGNVKLFDGLNGTFMGPCSFDIAALLADYIVFYHQHMLTEEDNDAHRQVSYKMIEACTQTVDAYFEQMTVSVDDREQYVSRLISEVAGLCGILLIARIAREAREDHVSQSVGTESLQSGVRLLGAAHRIHSASLLVNIALMLTL